MIWTSYKTGTPHALHLNVTAVHSRSSHPILRNGLFRLPLASKGGQTLRIIYAPEIRGSRIPVWNCIRSSLRRNLKVVCSQTVKNSDERIFSCLSLFFLTEFGVRDLNDVKVCKDILQKTSDTFFVHNGNMTTKSMPYKMAHGLLILLWTRLQTVSDLGEEDR